jgi:hypothetical protein
VSPPDSYKFHTVANITDQSNIVFSARGVADARVLLTDDLGSEPYEIVIGVWANVDTLASLSLIRRGLEGSMASALPTISILSPREDRFFWISWDSTQILFGRVWPMLACHAYSIEHIP